MDITPLVRPELKIIQSYGAGFFRVNGDIFQTNLLISGDTAMVWDRGNGTLFEQIFLIKDFFKGAEILLIGAGNTASVLPPAQRKAFKDFGLSADVMDTPSACRTYNILTAEGRRVAGAFLTVTS